MRKILFFLLFCYWWPIGAQNPFLPGPQIWLRTDSLKTGDIHWKDISGNNRHGIPSCEMPGNLGLLNFNPALVLKEKDFFTLPFTADQQITAIIVYQTEDSLSEQSLWQLTREDDKSIGLTTRRIRGEQSTITYTDRNDTHPIINSLSQSWKAVSPGEKEYSLIVGASDTLPYKGKLAECLFFDRTISDTVITQYISYLAIKYGITLYQTDYLDSRQNVIWNYHENPGYSYSIGGIGKDTRMGLNQKQSLLLDDKIKVSAGAPAVDNAANPYLLEEGTFLIWGFDSASYDSQEAIYLENGEEMKVYGKGLLQSFGAMASHIPTFLEADASEWEKDGTCYLLVDRSGTGEYLPHATEFYAAEYADSNDIYYFTDIRWDTDRNGKDHFCFVYFPSDSVFHNRNLAVSGPDQKEDNGNSHNEKSPSTRLESSSDRENQYAVYPNPNRGNFRIDIHYSEPSDVTVRIFSPEGKLTRIINGSDSQRYHFESSLSVKGHYLIDIIGAGERKSFKMIVQ